MQGVLQMQLAAKAWAKHYKKVFLQESLKIDFEKELSRKLFEAFEAFEAGRTEKQKEWKG